MVWYLEFLRVVDRSFDSTINYLVPVAWRWFSWKSLLSLLRVDRPSLSASTVCLCMSMLHCVADISFRICWRSSSFPLTVFCVSKMSVSSSLKCCSSFSRFEKRSSSCCFRSFPFTLQPVMKVFESDLGSSRYLVRLVFIQVFSACSSWFLLFFYSFWECFISAYGL